MKEIEVVNGQYKIRYHDFPGEKTPMLFIHGLGCAGSLDYLEVVAQPELCGHRRIIIDLLGAGFSDKPTQFDYTIENHALYLIEFIKALRLEKIILFGHSIGGAVALTIASLYWIYTNKVDSKLNGILFNSRHKNERNVSNVKLQKI